MSDGDDKWYHCRGCGLKGDAIELYGRLNAIDDIEESVRQLVALEAFKIPPSELTREKVLGYKYAWPDKRAWLDRCWDTLSSPGVQSDPEVVRLRHGEKLYVDSGKEVYKQFSRYFGAATRRAINRILEDKRILPTKGFATSMVVNFQDMPGRTCAMQFINDQGLQRCHHWPDPLNKELEGGLGMLETISPTDSTVFACDDYHLAAVMQLHRLLDYSDPLKLVLFNETTSRAWQMIKDKQVILWSRQVTPLIFKQARNLLNAYITSRPSFSIGADDYKYVIDQHPEGVIKVMEQNARPWLNFLQEWLVDPERDAIESKQMLAGIGLLDSERDAILGFCDKTEREKLQAILGDSKTIFSTSVDGTTVFVRDDSTYYRLKNGTEDFVFDAALSVDAEIYDPELDVKFWEGSVTYHKQVVPFRTEVSVIQDDPEAWLSNVVRRHGTVIVAPRFKTKLFITFQKLAVNMRHLEVSSRIGFYPDGKLMFPKFSVKDGTFVPEKSVVPEGIPASSVDVPCIRSRRAEDELFPERVAYIALAAAYVSNLLEWMHDRSPVPVLVAGQSNSVAHVAMQHLAVVSGMDRVEFNSSNQVEKLRKGFNKYGYPVYVEPDLPGLLSGWPAKSSDHVFLMTETLEAAAFNSSGTFITVCSPALSRDARALPPFDDTLVYMADLQRRNYELPPQFFLVDGIVEDLCAWHGRYFRLDHEQLLAAVKRVVSVAANSSDALMDLVFRFHSYGDLKLDHKLFLANLQNYGAMPGTKGSVFIDDEYNQVFIPRGLVVDISHARHLPTLDVKRIQSDFNRRNLLFESSNTVEGWIIPKAFWEEQAVKWRQKTI